MSGKAHHLVPWAAAGTVRFAARHHLMAQSHCHHLQKSNSGHAQSNVDLWESLPGPCDDIVMLVMRQVVLGMAVTHEVLTGSCCLQEANDADGKTWACHLK